MTASSPAVPKAPAPAAVDLQSEPFRLFFPLALLLGVAGVAHWLLFASGLIGRYLAQFHATTQMMSFLLAFAAGFLMTAVPKRTRTRPASVAEIAALLVLIPTTSLASLYNQVIVSDLSYLASLAVLIQFAVRRFFAGTTARRPPASFALLPMGLVAGIAGSVLHVAGQFDGAPASSASLGRALLLEGTFTCFVLGIGAFFFSLALRGDPPADLTRTRADVQRALGYAVAGAAVIAGLVIQDMGRIREGLAIRGIAALAVFVASGAIKLPTRPGINRRLIYLGGWAVPVGLLAAAIWPDHRVAVMHIVFVGGFGILATSVATHVTLGHGDATEAQDGRPWPVFVFGALFLVAMALRVIAGAATERYVMLLGAASAVWLAAVVVWAGFLARFWPPKRA